jgi:hypothetical protein
MNDKIKCQKCGVEFSPFNEKGKHNFCPLSLPNGKIINVCIKCKMEEIVKKWEKI